MQETPGTPGRGGTSAKTIAKDHVRQFPDVLHESRGNLLCIISIVVVEQKSN